MAGWPASPEAFCTVGGLQDVLAVDPHISPSGETILVPPLVCASLSTSWHEALDAFSPSLLLLLGPGASPGEIDGKVPGVWALHGQPLGLEPTACDCDKNKILSF